MFPPALVFDGVRRVFQTPAGTPRTALDGVDLEVPAGQVVALVGRSGSGKSTFLHLAAGIDQPSGGRVLVEGREISGMSEPERADMRRDHVGLVFQFFHLLSHLSVAENVGLPSMIAGGGADRDRALELLARVGLADRADDPVETLSGGEQQRVALCRALLRRPKLLLADEPTGNLDDETGQQVFELLHELVREQGATLVFVTHSRELACRADVTYRIHSGSLEPE